MEIQAVMETSASETKCHPRGWGAAGGREFPWNAEVDSWASPEPVEATRGCGRLNQSSCLKHWLRSGPWRAPGFDTGLLLI